jgi:hypothetical protein
MPERAVDLTWQIKKIKKKEEEECEHQPLPECLHVLIDIIVHNRICKYNSEVLSLETEFGVNKWSGEVLVW